jgi:transposase
MLTDTTTALPDDPEELKRIIIRLQKEQHRSSQEIDLLREQIRLLYAKLFGKKSEKRAEESTNPQLPLFDMPEPARIEPEREDVNIPAHTRQKRGRRPLPAELPRVEVIHDIDEAEKTCGCGAALSRIGEDVSEKLDIIPAVIQVIRHIRPKYACRQCEGVEPSRSLRQRDRSLIRASPQPAFWLIFSPPNSVTRCRFTGRRNNSVDLGRIWAGPLCVTGR